MAFKQESVEFFAKVEFGLKLAIQRLYEQKAANDEMAVISVNGVIQYVSAREVIEKQTQELLPNKQ